MTTSSPPPLPTPNVPDIPGLVASPLTPLLGRDREVRDLLRLLDSDTHRVVTLLGPGGVGKTRLAEDVTRAMAPAFAHGAAFVRLDLVRDPDELVQAVATGLGLQPSQDMTSEDILDRYLANRHMLLVLDNLEQVIGEASRLIARLLPGAPRLRILVTSRIPLHISSEQQYVVAPLGTTGDEPARSAAVTLFAERAAAVDPGFVLDDTTAPIVAQICQQLDGLPLAIELAAARMKILSPQALLARLTDRLTVLTGARRDVPQRLRSMRDAIAWSYELLSPDEQRLSRRLSVFLGGFSLDAAEFVAAWPDARGTGPSEIDLLQSLVDQSLVQAFPDGGNLRYRMLETIREFGLGRLDEEDDGEAQAAQAAYIRDLARRAERALIGPDQGAWLALLDAEYANIRAAASWLEHTGRLDDAVAIYAHVSGFLDIRGHIVETLPLLEEWLKRPELLAPTHTRALLLATISRFIHNTGDFDRGAILLEEAVDIFRDEGDLWHAAINNAYLGIMYSFAEDLPRAHAVLEESITLATAAGHHRALGAVLRMMSEDAWLQGDDTAFHIMLDRAIQISKDHGDWWLLTFCLQNQSNDAMAHGRWDEAQRIVLESMRIRTELRGRQELPADWWALATIAQAQGDERAEEYLLNGLRIAEETGHAWYITLLQFKLGTLAIDHGDLPGASHILREHVRSFRTHQRMDMLALAMAVLAVLATKAGDAIVAARFLGASVSLDPTAAERRIDPVFQVNTRASRDSLLVALGPQRYERENETGAAWSPDDAIAAALAYAPSLAEPGKRHEKPEAAPLLQGLSTRERDVLVQMANGLSNQEIADTLFISYRTATTHVTSILTKLDVSSRTAAVAWAIRNGIA